MTNKKYILIFIIIVLFILAWLDAVNFFTIHNINDWISLSHINIVNWSNLFISITGSSIAILGTWFFTNNSAKKQIRELQTIHDAEVIENANNLLLDKVFNLKIYYLIKNVYLDTNKSLGENFSAKFEVVSVNNVDVNYLEWQRELNILEKYLHHNGKIFDFHRVILFMPFLENTMSNSVVDNENVYLVMDYDSMLRLPDFYYQFYNIIKYKENLNESEVELIGTVDIICNRIYGKDFVDIEDGKIDEQYKFIRNKYKNFIKSVKKLETGKNSSNNSSMEHYKQICTFLSFNNAIGHLSKANFKKFTYVDYKLLNDKYVTFYPHVDTNGFLTSKSNMNILIDSQKFGELLRVMEDVEVGQ